MLKASQILVRTLVLAASAAALAGCGQRGPLYLPTDPAAAQRATLPQTLTPSSMNINSSTGTGAGVGTDNSASPSAPEATAPAPAAAASAPR